MGGQACIVYGAAQFSRDIDFAVEPSPENLRRLRRALHDLRAVPVFLPPLALAPLRRGHACHFRCGGHPPALRIDVMSVMRGADPFRDLWKRRTAISLRGVGSIDLVALADLVTIKKTQRDKDWPMLRALVEADIERAGVGADPERIRFWMKECRSPALLRVLVHRHPEEARRAARRRVVLRHALRGNWRGVERSLAREERVERERDRRYWAPLRAELERWRLARAHGRAVSSSGRALSSR